MSPTTMMRIVGILLPILLVAGSFSPTLSFVTQSPALIVPADGSTQSFKFPSNKSPVHPSSSTSSCLSSSAYNDDRPTTSVYLDTKLTPERITNLYAWISRAFLGDPDYNNLMLAMAAVFGSNLPPDSDLLQMLERAKETLPKGGDSIPMGEGIPRRQREQASLGAMGAGQWLGQFKTRPHALLDLNANNITSVDQWTKSLPRGCRRTLKKANSQNFTITALEIGDGLPAPHSSLSHFTCVVEHEVRLLTYDEDDTEGFLNALSAAVGRYVETTRMTGTIYEYRNSTSGRIIGFAHEVKKGGAIRGQWFYCTDEGSRSYVWFHSVQELVRRACEDGRVSVADLGPSGSDSFSELKGRYGFESVEDWTMVADYTGPFWYDDDDVDGSGKLDGVEGKDRGMLEDLLRLLGE